MPGKRRAFAFVCAAVFAVCALAARPWQSARAESFFYGAVNDTLFDCDVKYMPVNLPSGLVAPSRLLTDGGLGLRGQFDAENRVYTLSGSSPAYLLTFDMARAVTYDAESQYDAMAFEVSGVVYLPLAFICERFGLTYKAIETDCGVVMRVTPQGRMTPDSEFIPAVSGRLEEQRAAYRRVNDLPPLAAERPSPGAETPPPAVIPAPPPMVTLLIDVTAGGAWMLDGMLDALDGYGVAAAVFFTEEALDSGHGLARRALKSHVLGVLYGAGDGDGFEEAVDGLNAANRALRGAAMTQTRFARVTQGGAALTGEDEERFQGAGYVICGAAYEVPNIKNAREVDKTASDMAKKIEAGAGEGTAVLRVDCREFAPEFLSALLKRLDERNTVFLYPRI